MWHLGPSVVDHFSLIYAGEGTFGVVRQAKAEGIVESTPERNIVAVKTAKGMSTKVLVNR